MRKNILFRISSYILAAAVFVGGGAWVATTFGGNASTGVLPESAGGTGATTFKSTLTANANGDASSILYSDLTASRLLTSNTSGKVSVLGSGNANQILQSNGSSSPSWVNPQQFRVGASSITKTNSAGWFSKTVTFSTAFPNACSYATLNFTGTAAVAYANDVVLANTSCTTTTATFYFYNQTTGGNGSTIPLTYFAYGS